MKRLISVGFAIVTLAAMGMCGGCTTEQMASADKTIDQLDALFGTLADVASNIAPVIVSNAPPVVVSNTPPAITNAPPVITNAPPAVTNAAESDIPAGTKWLHTDVSGWPVTSKLDASVGGGTIRVSYDKTRVWPAVDNCNANPWVFVNVNGQWYAATFEYLKFGQTTKPMGVLDRSGGKGDHIKRAPLSSWTPSHDEKIGLMVSGLARASGRNVKERTQVQMVTWP